MIWRAGLDANCNYFSGVTWLKFTGKTMEQGSRRGLARRRASGGQGLLHGHLQRVRLNGARAEMEYRLKRHDGLWRWINDRGVPTFDAEHRFTGYIGSCMDVTEKVEGS